MDRKMEDVPGQVRAIDMQGTSADIESDHTQQLSTD